MDRISIEALRVNTIIGIHPHEQAGKQPVVINIDIFTDFTAAAASDDIADTASYGDVARAVTAFVESSRLNLVETLAERIAGLLLDRFNIDHVIVRVAKPQAVANADTISVTIERQRH